jgi:REP element-mobilizing transposase RayT
VVLGTHVIFGAYGFWLPNDPRGSWSKFVGSWQLLKYGRPTNVTTRRSVAHVRHDAALRKAAKSALEHPPVHFNGIQARAIARGFATAVQMGSYMLSACCILPEHVHLVVVPHIRPVQVIVGHLKAAATRQLLRENLHPFVADGVADEDLASPWARRCWKVFLYSPADMRRAISYAENNPMKEGKPRQQWSFVTAYAG